MKQIQFPEWAEVLAQRDLPGRQKASWTITLRWYLNFCRRGRAGVTVQSARDFIEWAQKEKHPEPWQLELWETLFRILACIGSLLICVVRVVRGPFRAEAAQPRPIHCPACVL